MKLAIPAIHPENGARVLVQSGTELTARSISRLGEQNIHEIWIAWPGLEFIREDMSPPLDQSHRQFARQLGKTFDLVAKDMNAQADYGSLKRSISDFLDRLMESPRSAAYLSELLGADSPHLRHASAVCLMSILVGLKLGGYLVKQRRKLPPREAANVVNLGVGAMLHDIGMLHLDPEVIKRFNQTEDESEKAWREHVNIGHRLVTGKIDPTAAATVMHHHQRYDGNGFPQSTDDDRIFGVTGREGENIHIFARIVAAADLFDRIRFGGQDAPRASRVSALHQLRMPMHSGRLDPVVVDGVLAVTPPYPPGSMVKLSTGDNAVVIAWTPVEPCRPTVRVIGELDAPSGSAAEGITVDLRENPTVEIAETDGLDTLHDNFYFGLDGLRAA